MFDLQMASLASFFTTVGPENDMRARVLIIEDDRDIADLIATYLQRDGIDTDIAGSGEDGLLRFRAAEPDLVVLDINLPGMDGYEVLQSLKRDRDVPVLMVTARQEDEDAILGFGMGADDYIAKPFSPRVLAARVRTHLSRIRKVAAAVAAAADAAGTDGSAGPSGDRKEIAFGPFVLDTRAFALFRNGDKLSMSPREIDLLMNLATDPGIPRSQEDLYREVWGREYGDISTVAVHGQRVRKKIEDDPSHPRWVKTAHGRGYYFDPEGEN